jgi:hypothetical protein
VPLTVLGERPERRPSRVLGASHRACRSPRSRRELTHSRLCRGCARMSSRVLKSPLRAGSAAW